MLLVAMNSFALDDYEDYSGENTMRYMISIDGNMLLSTYGVGQGAIVNAGYELLPIPYVGVQASLNVWVFLETFIGATTSVNIHVLGDSPVDPYIGLGVCYLYLMDDYYYGTLIDVPLIFGLNMMMNRSFGLKLQAKTFLLSLSEPIFEVGVGLVVAFKTRSGW